MKVLIIEDDPTIIESVALCFNLRWIEVEWLSASQGEEGLKLAKTESPDIIILDLGLPDMDGLDVLRQIRSFSKVPVVILTVRDREMDKVAGLELGADDYIVKPFALAEFLSRVKAVIRRSQMPESQVDEKPLVTGELRIDFAARKASVAGKPLKLSPDGYKLLLETLAQKDHAETKVEDTKVEEVPCIHSKMQVRRSKVALGQFVHYLKSSYRLFLDKVKRYSIFGKRREGGVDTT